MKKIQISFINKINKMIDSYNKEVRQDAFEDDLQSIKRILFKNTTENQIKLFLKLKENLESNLIEKEENNTKESALISFYFKNEKSDGI